MKVSGSVPTHGCRKKPLRRLNTLTLRPMPTVSVATIVTLSHGFLAISRKAKRTSWQTVSNQ